MINQLACCRPPSGNLSDMRTLSFATEDLRSANELRDGIKAGTQTPASKPGANTPTLSPSLLAGPKP